MVPAVTEAGVTFTDSRAKILFQKTLPRSSLLRGLEQLHRQPGSPGRSAGILAWGGPVSLQKVAPGRANEMLVYPRTGLAAAIHSRRGSGISRQQDRLHRPGGLAKVLDLFAPHVRPAPRPLDGGHEQGPGTPWGGGPSTLAGYADSSSHGALVAFRDPRSRAMTARCASAAPGYQVAAVAGTGSTAFTKVGKGSPFSGQN